MAANEFRHEISVRPETVPHPGLGPSQRVVRLPVDISLALPSRGMVPAKVLRDGREMSVILEPDGTGSHWFAVNDNFPAEAEIELTVTKTWPDLILPADIAETLAGDDAAQAIWQSLTPAAQWDWVRWAGACRTLETRAKRVESIPSRLRSGKRRPCCFDRNQCTLTVR